MTQPIAPAVQPAHTRLGYQPALDGLRAIAISLVLLFHYPFNGSAIAGTTPMHGGFLGVDVFFVLSGFLITTLLLDEHAAIGAVSIRRFYARRALRLLPAFAVLWVVGLAVHFTRLPQRPQTLALVGALLYAENWVVIHRASAGGMLGHTWSLAIEEQFYLVWPVILVFLMRTRLRLTTIAAFTGVAALATAAYRAFYWHTHLHHANYLDFFFARTLRQVSPSGPGTLSRRVLLFDRVYFGSDTRADALLVGCFTALVLTLLLPRFSARHRNRLGLASVGALIGGAFIVAHGTLVMSGWLPLWGFLTLEILVAVVIAGLVASPRAPLARLLSLPPLLWVGRRSYAIYLFHVPIFIYFNRSRVHLSPPISFIFQVTLVLVAAEISHRLVEAPMLRRKKRLGPNFTS